MLKKILLTGFAVLFLFGKTADAAAAPFAVIDRVCYNQILDSLTIDPDDITLYKKIFRAIKAEAGFFMGNGGEAFDRGVLPPYHRSQRGEMVCWLIPIWKKEPSG